MNYKRTYLKIIKKAKSQNRQKNMGVYYEGHHILPVSLFPLWRFRNSNIVLLTAREHFFCHQLLTKIYPGNKMFSALRFMADSKTELYKVTSKEYERIRKSCCLIGENNSFYGRTHSDKTKQIIGEKCSIRQIGDKNPFYGKTHSNETKEKLRKSQINRKHSIEQNLEHSRKMMGNDPTPKKVRCINTNVIYKSMKEASRNIGFCYGSLKNAIKSNTPLNSYYYEFLKENI
jgi:hypothetical protein